MKIGVVQDYVNTEELDAMIASGAIKGEAVPSDVLNVKKVGLSDPSCGYRCQCVELLIANRCF